MYKKLSVVMIIFISIMGCAKGVSKETMNQLEETRRALEAAKAALNECRSEKENLTNQKTEKENLLKNLEKERDSLSKLLEAIKQGY
ncbi:MAG: hypothetical protein ABIM29_05590 [candidate division WOR-3 bacterium]